MQILQSIQHAYDVLLFEAFFRQSLRVLCKNVNFWFFFVFGVKNLFLVNWIENEEISQTNTLYR